MRPALYLAILAPALIAGSAALGGELLKPTMDLYDMRIVVTYVSTGDFVNLQRKYGTHIGPP